jgi:hypothetical protein
LDICRKAYPQIEGVLKALEGGTERGYSPYAMLEKVSKSNVAYKGLVEEIKRLREDHLRRYLKIVDRMVELQEQIKNYLEKRALVSLTP